MSFKLRPNSWTTDLHRCKQVSRSSKSKLCKEGKNAESITKSSDWIEATLEVPEKDFSMSFENAKLQPIFNESEAGTPVPPPRKQKKGIKEKIEAAAKSGLLALQPKKSIEEPLCIKKKIDYSCPCHDPRHKHNIENQNKVEEKNMTNRKEQKLGNTKRSDREKESKRRKNLSVVSLPNYSDLKFTVANFTDIDGNAADDKQIKSSNVSLPQETKVGGTKSYMVRCRSFGSLLPQQLLEKLKPTPNIVPSAESDDSFGALEDWDLDLIEHYNPRDASLPRPRRPVSKPEKHILSDIEKQIMKEDMEILPDLTTKVTNSTETLLLSDDSPTFRVLNTVTSSAEPHSLNSIDIYDSIENYENVNLKTFEKESSEILTNVESSSSQPILSRESEMGKTTIQNVIEEFIESEKKNVNTG
ncbi:uncharacterized protein LOC123321131 isoform X2 [Coccinella septempunctata]|uniref:uncharacterized protein LOC123321131 isoform X2 n=1 Tax=Coccinella septempunctata TaxID=41139 RepID=UPI001D08EE9B|nr:uncharacterized protein LOC123321131 isoform X2 [Coccinella septempunctata]